MSGRQRRKIRMKEKCLKIKLLLLEGVKSLKDELLLVESLDMRLISTGIYWGSYAKWIWLIRKEIQFKSFIHKLWSVFYSILSFKIITIIQDINCKILSSKLAIRLSWFSFLQISPFLDSLNFTLQILIT